MLYRVPVIDDALHGFDHILEALGFRIVRPERCFGLPEERLFPVFRRRRPEVVAGLGEVALKDAAEAAEQVLQTGAGSQLRIRHLQIFLRTAEKGPFGFAIHFGCGFFCRAWYVTSDHRLQVRALPGASSYCTASYCTVKPI
jgi:hypothetical protein